MNAPQPPKWADRFLRWFCSDQVLEFLQGDLYELYADRLARYGKFRAGLLFTLEVFSACRPFAFRRVSTQTNQLAMIRNYLKITWRTMIRQKMYAGVKIGGFALGIAACILIALFIRKEFSYDNFYKNGELIYRVYNEADDGVQHDMWTSFPAPIGEILNTEFPEVTKAARLIPYQGWFEAGNNLIRRADQRQNTYEEGFAYADPGLLEILQIPMVYGTRQHALNEPNTIVISKRKADQYFPDLDPVGQTLILDGDESKTYTIGGVFEDFPDNSHLQFDFLLTLKDKEFWVGEQSSWCCWNYHAYIQVKPGTDVAALEDKLLAVRDNHYLPYLQKKADPSTEDVKNHYFLRLQPVRDIYLRSEGIHDSLTHNDIRFIWLFGAVGCFILLLACINFVNLATARSANRAKEVGLRKVVGSLRIHLVRQFLTESIVYSFISVLIGIGIAWLTLPYFNLMADKSLQLPWSDWWFFPLLTAVAFGIGIAAGLYPAFYLSAFKPINVLKGSLRMGSRSSTMRSALVIFQFTASIVLIIGTLVVYRQMQYILNAKIGYDKEQVIMIHGANTLNEKQQPFKEELLKLSVVEAATVSGYLPIEGTHRDQNEFWREGKSKEEKAVNAQRWYVDHDYLRTMGMNLVAGRNFDPMLASDSQAIIINQAMAKEFGFEDPVGQRIQNWMPYTVIGVVEDFHFESLKGEIRPLSLVYGKYGDVISLRTNTSYMKEALATITGVWDSFAPHQSIRYDFMDDRYAQMYDDVQRMGRVFTACSILAIIVACLGLFGLSAYMVEQRGKEISIRKVLGASLGSIFNLLTLNFLKLVIIALIAASPLAWYLMKLWLDDYSYRIDITWDIFAIAGGVSILIALITISSESIKAGLVNPAQKLRSE